MAATENQQRFYHGFFGVGAEVQGTVVRVTVGEGTGVRSVSGGKTSK